jgi:hypothetical protein
MIPARGQVSVYVAKLGPNVVILVDLAILG